MASLVKNQGGKPQKLTRGFPVNLGTLAANGDVVAFTIPEPSRDHQGNLVIQVGPGIAGGTFALEASLDGAVSWAVVTGTSLGVSGQPGSDTAAVFAAQYNVSGFGAGAQFRFGLATAPTSGNSAVTVLVG
jgi:hypothetical protein